jgi:hypothetical protein
MLGSIFFGISAVAGYVVPATGDLLDAALDTSGTFWGAVCFLIGALLLLPEARAPSGPGQPPSPDAVTPSPTGQATPVPPRPQ